MRISLNFPNWKFLKFWKLQIFWFFQISNFWNFSNWQFLEFSKLYNSEIRILIQFQNCKILQIFYISKLLNFRNLMILETVKFGKFLESSNWKLLEFFKLANFGNSWNFSNCKIDKFLDFFQFGKSKFGNIIIVYPFDIPLLAILPILIFALWYKSIFSIFISYFSDL